jgi:hypothetical protein
MAIMWCHEVKAPVTVMKASLLGGGLTHSEQITTATKFDLIERDFSTKLALLGKATHQKV